MGRRIVNHVFVLALWRGAVAAIALCAGGITDAGSIYLPAELRAFLAVPIDEEVPYFALALIAN